METRNKIYRYKKYSFDEVDQSFTKQWSELMSRSLEPSAYLDPNFLIPSEKYLKEHVVYLRAIYCTKNNITQLVGLGLFTLKWCDKRMPFPHLQAYKSIHSFLTGLLVDKEETKQILEFFFANLAREFWYCSGVRFIDFPAKDKLANQISNIRSISWHEFWAFERAVYLLPSPTQQEKWQSEISKKRLKNYQKSYRELDAIGTIAWKYINSEDIDQKLIDEYLVIEDSGWKGDNGTSLLSNLQEVKFFNSLVKRLKQENKIFFTTLRLNEKLIAATCNLILNEKAFAFKIGWDDQYKKYSPGIINEIEFLKYANTENCEFTCIESGATEDSFINDYWKQRWYLAEGIYSFNLYGKATNISNDYLRKMIKKVLVKIKSRLEKIIEIK